MLQLKRLKQKQLADGLGETPQTVSKWLTGAMNPNVPNLLRIADFLEVSVDSIFGRVPPGTEFLLDVRQHVHGIADALDRILPAEQAERSEPAPAPKAPKRTRRRRKKGKSAKNSL